MAPICQGKPITLPFQILIPDAVHAMDLQEHFKFQGVVNFNKPAGLSSARVVGQVKRLLPRGTKIGHAGTLDPFATGVLLLLVGKATRWCERLMDAPKQYRATIKFGATTATDDCDSPEQIVPTATVPSAMQVTDALQKLVGQVLQRPPAFSALKLGGRRAYDLARAGQSPPVQPRIVRIDAIELLRYEWPLADLRVDCGRGTYIRAIARDVGATLGVGGYLTALERTRVGQFHIEQSVGLAALAEAGVAAHLTQLADAPN